MKANIRFLTLASTSVSSPGFFRDSDRKRPDANSCPPPDHRPTSSANDTGEETGGSGPRCGPASAGP